jgi:hypothetical protein
MEGWGMNTKTNLRVIVSFVSILALTAVLFTGLIGVQEAKAAPVTIGLQSSGKITKLIYPTFGNPAIKKKGETFVIEFDPREGVRWIPPENLDPLPIPSCTNFAVSATSTNDPYPITKTFTVVSSGLGYGTQWPGQYEYLQRTTPDNRIYLVTVQVPENIPADLYDLTISCNMSGVPTTDKQIHSFDAIDAYKDHPTFVQLSDIHVFGSEVSYPSSNQQERHQRQTVYSETGDNGYGRGYGAEYLHEAIVQLNKMKPDFIINTGDNEFGQFYFSQTNAQRSYGSFGEMTEYEYEQLWFYNEMTKLDVPIFMVLGNHDGYKESTGTSPPAKTNQDWQYNFRKIWGPLYRPFDYGNIHFSLVNSLDWAGSLRTLQLFGPFTIPFYGTLQIMQPVKYKGQIADRGDNWQVGHSDLRFSQVNPGVFIGQLQWLANDLATHQTSKARVIAMHHDPLKDGDPSTSGSMWSSSESSGSGGTIDDLMRIFGLVTDMGNGSGRLASMRLMKDYKVGLCISGHDHSDWYGTLPWSGGGGQVQFVNSTSTSFQSNAASNVYPGYQKFVMDNTNGQFTFGYSSNLSYPFYQGTNVGGSTNLGGLNTPAIQYTWNYTPSQSTATSATCNLTNTLTLKSLPSAYMEFPMQYLNNKHYYQVTNGTFGDIYDNAGLDHRICQVYTDVDAAPPLPAPPTPKNITVSQSPEADNTKPTGTVKINNGATSTETRDVTLNLALSDAPSGLKDIMVSNSSGFSGAEWEKYKTSKPWTLTAGNGTKTVYVKARDMAMPPNEKTFTATIELGSYNPPVPPEPPINPVVWYLAEGTSDWGFDTYINIENPNNQQLTAKVTYMTPTGKIDRPNVTLAPLSQTVINPRNDLPASMDFSTKVECVEQKPIYVDRRMIWQGQGAVSPEGHSSVGVTTPVKSWFLAEGSSKWGFETWLLIQNPGDTDATCNVTYMVEGVPKPVVVTHKVKAKSRNTFSMGTDIGQGDSSIRVDSDVPVIAERSMYRNNRREGHDSIGTTSPANDFYLAEGTTDWGFTTYLLVQNPNSNPTKVTVTYMTPNGPVVQPGFTMDANSRKTIDVNGVVAKKDLSIHVNATLPIVAERAMYWNNGTGEACHDSIGMSKAHTAFYLPDGETYNGTETWTLVQNPNGSKVTIEIKYLTVTGKGNVTFEDTIPANSRRTYNMAAKLPNNRASVVVTCKTSGKKVMVERAMYWNNRGAGTGTIGGYSD